MIILSHNVLILHRETTIFDINIDIISIYCNIPNINIIAKKIGRRSLNIQIAINLNMGVFVVNGHIVHNNTITSYFCIYLVYLGISPNFYVWILSGSINVVDVDIWVSQVDGPAIILVSVAKL